MRRATRHILWAILAVALFAVSPAAAQDASMESHGDHAAMASMNATASDAGATMEHTGHDMAAEPADHSGHDMAAESAGPADHSDHDAAAMPVEGHDHAAVMEKAKEVGIEEKLGNIIADATFLDSEGKEVNLRDLTGDVPTIVIPIYFRCPDVCNLLQGSFAEILPDVALKPGKEFRVVSISFDPRENVADAARAKKTYLAAAGGEFPAEDWKFLVGDQANIDKWLDSIGYTVKRDGGIYAHPVAVVAVAPGGKVVRYLYGTTFLPFDITMAATEAASGKTGLSIKRMLSFCYNYDPQGRRYVFSILRVSGFAIFSFVGLFILYLVLSGRKHKKKKA